MRDFLLMCVIMYNTEWPEKSNFIFVMSFESLGTVCGVCDIVVALDSGVKTLINSHQLL